jgi:lipoprotein-anchoring transpeptidase ErfK/SrfK
MGWATERLSKKSPRYQASVEKIRLLAAKPAPVRPKKAPGPIRLSYVLSALIALCLGVSAIIVLSAANPVALIGTNIVTHEQEGKSWMQVSFSRAVDTATSAPTQMPSPTFTLTATLSPTATFTPTVTYTATSTSTEIPTLVPTDLPTEAASPTPLPTDTAEPIPTQYVQVQASSGSGGVHWIEVDLSDQMVYAYEGKTIVNSFLVSTGVSPYKTITGSFHIYDKVLSGNMWGPGYYLPDVPYIMYFQKGYALHGTYWHNNFGTPMSHGCVNLSIPDAEWLYYWAPLGTSVKVHQ